MGILDTFFLVFEADASNLDKGLTDAHKKSDKLTDQLKLADLAGGKLGSSLGNLLATAGGAMMAIFSVGAMTSGIAGAIDYADHLNDLSNGLGVATEDLDSWGKAVKMSGGTAEEFQGTLSTLSADFAMIATKGTSRTLPFWKELGINVKDAHGKMREVMDVLPELADKMAGMSKQESAGMGKKLGLDQGTIMLLQQGRREVEAQIKQQKEMGVVTAEQAKQAGEFNDALDQLSMNFRGMFLSVGGSLIPAFKWIIEMFGKVSNFFREHSDFITGLFIALGAAVLFFLIPPLITAAGAALAAMAPFLLMGAVVALVAGAFALLYDDVMNFMEGNDSMIGSLYNKYPVVRALIDGIAEAFRTLKAVAKEIWGLMGDVFNFGSVKAKQFWKSLTGGIDGFSKTFPRLFALIKGLGNVFSAVFTFIWNLWKKVFGGIGNAISGLAKSVGLDFSVKGLQNARSQVQAASKTPLNSTNSAAISNSKVATKNASVNVGKVEVHTKATDAQGVARAVGGHMKGELKRATSNYDDGVLA